MKKLFLFAIVVLGFSAVSFGQTGKTATATASATIVTPINITKNVDLNFGNIAVNANSGTVELAASEAATRTIDGGITLPVVNGSPTAAKFTVTGVAGYLYHFTIPATEYELEVTNGSHSMTIDSWTSSATGTLTGGTEIVYVGATIHVDGGEAAGEYNSEEPFTVSVDYE